MKLIPGILVPSLMIATLHGAPTETQLTRAEHGHVLTNVNAWSPDGRWIAYDVRNDGFDGTRIERVNAGTGETREIYTAKKGAGCGVVTYSPTEPRVVFILGPENPSPGWHYGFTRRRGVIVDERQPGQARPLDAENYAPPFVAGALRGGTHVHVFSPDGRWVSFTYEDDVLEALGTTGRHDLNQRNIGVSVPFGPVKVAPGHPRNNDGDFFTVLVTRTVNTPRPGSDEIDRAFEEGWIGANGYLRADGTRQAKALAFQGNVVGKNGTRHAEVFLVDLPDDLTREDNQPLAGTATQRPAPPPGVVQRRLTFTGDRSFPGVAQAPRHWLRASPDGSQIAYLAQDDAGKVQLWLVSPHGGAPRQVTHNTFDIASAFTWSPDGRTIAHVADGSIFATDVATGRGTRLTAQRLGSDTPQALACVFSPDGQQIAYTRVVATGPDNKQFSQVFVVTVSPARPPG